MIMMLKFSSHDSSRMNPIFSSNNRSGNQFLVGATKIIVSFQQKWQRSIMG